jgi:putative phosphoesterase
LKIGLLGDIHGNSLALRAVLESAKARGVEQLCLTGDFVGYYYHPDEVLDLLASWPHYAVRGNHENMFFDAIRSPVRMASLEGKYGSGLRQAQARLRSEQLDWLEKLPEQTRVEIAGVRILLAHGAPWDGDCYLYPDSPEESWLKVAADDFDLVVLGHTHYRFQRKMGNTLIVNPGSVGQARDRIVGAAWAIFDSEKMICEHLTASYDISHVVEEASINDPDKLYLQEVLTRR